MAKKFYAVRQGRKTGLFTAWNECKKQIDGFAGAIYKGFMTESEAQAWLAGDAVPPPAAKRPSPRSSPPRGPGNREEAAPAPDADFVVYTDGSCLRNPDGPEGYAAVILDRSGQVTEISGGAPATTNNRMELTAGIEALRRLPDGATVEFYTDSQYLQNAFTKRWLASWKRRGWVTAAGTPVKNQTLWQALEAEIGRLVVRFHWVKGHAGNEWNERCDALARAEAARQA